MVETVTMTAEEVSKLCRKLGRGESAPYVNKQLAYVVPVIPNIDQRILDILTAGTGKLEMWTWHAEGKCGTAHCRAGWAIHLGGDAGYTLERQLSPGLAGALIYHVSRPGTPTPSFIAGNKGAMEDLIDCAAKYTKKETKLKEIKE